MNKDIANLKLNKSESSTNSTSLISPPSSNCSHESNIQSHINWQPSHTSSTPSSHPKSNSCAFENSKYTDCETIECLSSTKERRNEDIDPSIGIFGFNNNLSIEMNLPNLLPHFLYLANFPLLIMHEAVKLENEKFKELNL